MTAPPVGQKAGRKDCKMLWSWVDAVNLAIDLKELEEYRDVDVDKLANELWAEMLRDNSDSVVWEEV
jgi:hypothetical protein